MAPLARWNTPSPVKSIAVSQDGNRAVSGSDDGRIRVWDMHTGALVLGPLEGHTRSVGSVAFSYDGAHIVSGSDDGTVRIWNARSGISLRKPLNGHTDSVCSVAFSPDNTQIVSGSCDHTIRFWDAHTGDPIGDPIIEHSNVVSSVAFSHDGTRVVSGSWDCTIRIWDAHTKTPVGRTIEGHSRSVYSVAFSPDSTRIVSGSWDRTIRLWDARTGAPIGKPLKGHTGSVTSVSFSPDNTLIVSGSFDDTIRIWDARSGAPVGEMVKGHTSVVSSVTFLPGSTRIISSSLDHTICVWDLRQEQQEQQDPPSFDMVTGKVSAQVIFDVLVKHRSTDLSSSIDPTRYSLAPIASWAFGDVWQAYLTNGVLVAVKCLRLHLVFRGGDKGIKRMMRQVYVWSKLQHENIHELLGIVMFQGQLGMVSLWRSNGDLRSYIKIHPGVDRYSLCVQVARGVAYLHEVGMVHGDIKATNVLVSAEGIAKISDWDHSILSETTLHFSESTQGGGGTVRWMAPELLLHEEDEETPPATRNKKTDVYALGMTMLEIISGKVPYHQIPYDSSVVLALSKKRLPRRPEKLDAPNERGIRIWELLLRCWNHDPEARPDAPTVLEYLQNVVVGTAYED